MGWIQALNGLLYDRVLLFLLPLAGLYLSAKYRFVQLRLLPEACRVLKEPAGEGASLSSFAALMVSTASKVGTGNIAGVSAALCLGGSGALFWLILTSLIGAGAAFAEATIAQLWKRRAADGRCFGGPILYLRRFFGRRPAALFALLLLFTHGVGFNMLSAYNLQSAFSAFSFYDPAVTPWCIGLLLAPLCFLCLRGGGARVARFSTALVPFMALLYLALALRMLIRQAYLLPSVLWEMLRSAFDFRAIAGGLSGSCLLYGLRRGLFSNEAGMGSAPNAAAAAEVSHPVKQGLVQMLSCLIDTLLCVATAVICLLSGVSPRPELAGMPFVLLAAGKIFGPAGTAFVTLAVVLFAFTTLLGNFFYLENTLLCLRGRESSSFVRFLSQLLPCLLIFAGCGMSMETVWALTDLGMAGLCLLHLPLLLVRQGDVQRCLQDYERQRRTGRDPVFRATASAFPCSTEWQKKTPPG